MTHIAMTFTRASTKCYFTFVLISSIECQGKSGLAVQWRLGNLPAPQLKSDPA